GKSPDESKRAENLPEEQASVKSRNKRAAKVDETALVWTQARQAYLESRQTFLSHPDVIGVGYGPRIVDGHEIMEEPTIIVLTRKQTDELTFPPNVDG